MPKDSLTIDDLYNEIVKLAREQGVTGREMWNEIVDEVVEGHVDLGELDQEEDTEGMKEILRAKWNNFKEEMAEEEANSDEYEEDTTTAVDETKEEKDEEDKDDDDGFGLNGDDDY